MPTLPERYDRIGLGDLLDAGFERKRYAALRPLMFEGLGGRVARRGRGHGAELRLLPGGCGRLGHRRQARRCWPGRRRAARRCAPAGRSTRTWTCERPARPAPFMFDGGIVLPRSCVLPDDDAERGSSGELARGEAGRHDHACWYTLSPKGFGAACRYVSKRPGR